MSTLTYYTLFMEVVVVLLLFVPFKNSFFRYVAVLMILSLHWGIDLFVNVGFFKWYATCIGVLLLPASFWVRLPSGIGNLSEKIFPRRVIAIGPNKLTRILEGLLALYLVFMILETNLYQTVTSKTNDRVGLAIKKTGLNRTIKNLMPAWWPQYSFMRQFWHLYSPNPPSEKGYMQFEFATDNGIQRVSNGKPLPDGVLYSSMAEQHLLMYLTLRQVRNKREQIALKSKLMFEIDKWNRAEENPKLYRVDVVVYSYKPTIASDITSSRPNYTRNVIQSVDIDYGKN